MRIYWITRKNEKRKMKTLLLILLFNMVTFGYNYKTDPLNRSHIKLGMGIRDKTVTTFLTNVIQLNDDMLFITTYETWIGGVDKNGTAFKPKDINFMVGFQYKNMGVLHNCFHTIDKERPKGRPMKNRFYIDI